MCVLIKRTWCAKAHEPIEMQFGEGDSSGSKEPLIRWGQNRTNLFAATRGDKSAIWAHGLAARKRVNRSRCRFGGWLEWVNELWGSKIGRTHSQPQGVTSRRGGILPKLLWTLVPVSQTSGHPEQMWTQRPSSGPALCVGQVRVSRRRICCKACRRIVPPESWAGCRSVVACAAWGFHGRQATGRTACTETGVRPCAPADAGRVRSSSETAFHTRGTRTASAGRGTANAPAGRTSVWKPFRRPRTGTAGGPRAPACVPPDCSCTETSCCTRSTCNYRFPRFCSTLNSTAALRFGRRQPTESATVLLSSRFLFQAARTQRNWARPNRYRTWLSPSQPRIHPAGSRTNRRNRSASNAYEPCCVSSYYHGRRRSDRTRGRQTDVRPCAGENGARDCRDFEISFRSLGIRGFGLHYTTTCAVPSRWLTWKIDYSPGRQLPVPVNEPSEQFSKRCGEISAVGFPNEFVPLLSENPEPDFPRL